MNLLIWRKDLSENKLKILYIGHERKLGGASLCLVSMAEEMKIRGHEVIVILPFRHCPVGDKLNKLGIPVFGVFFGWWMAPNYWNVAYRALFSILHFMQFIPAYRICRIIKKNKIDIVHSNSSTIDIGNMAAKKSKIAHVWHFREFGDLDYKLMFIKGRKESLKQVAAIDGRVVFISRCLRKYYPELTENVEVIYDGISSQYLNYSCPFYKESRKVTFLIAGNLQRNKGQKTVLEAVRLLKENGIVNYCVLIAVAVASTRDSVEYAEELRQYIVSHKLEEVRLLGRIEDMNALRRKCDVEIVASVMEAFGRVTIEAMLSGRPVLASDSGANPELIQDKVTGWLFKSGDAESLAVKMENIIMHPQWLENMGKTAYMWAKENYMSEKNTQQIEELYQFLLKK